MSTTLLFLILGLGSGAAYAALALGLVVTYRSSGVVNLATGAVALYVAYTYAFLRQGELVDPVPGLNPTPSIGTTTWLQGNFLNYFKSKFSLKPVGPG